MHVHGGRPCRACADDHEFNIKAINAVTFEEQSFAVAAMNNDPAGSIFLAPRPCELQRSAKTPAEHVWRSDLARFNRCISREHWNAHNLQCLMAFTRVCVHNRGVVDRSDQRE